MSDNILNIELKQGCSWKSEITLTDENGAPIDLTGCTFVGHAKKSYESSVVEYEFAFDDLGGGIVEVSLENDFYQKKIVSNATFVYDWILILANGDREPLFEGVNVITPRIA